MLQLCIFLGPISWRPSRDMVAAVNILRPITGLQVSIRSSYLITIVFMLITAAVLAEICSALPLSGSIYIWAAESAGPKYARFFGFIVAWWSCTAWMTFAAGNCQVNIVALCWIYEAYNSFRPLRITLSLNSRCGVSISPEALRTTTSNGAH